jgi:hypothetical protein
VSTPERLRQAYHDDLTDCPILLDAAEEIERLRAALDQIVAMDPKGIRADDLGRAVRIARAALEAKT